MWPPYTSTQQMYWPDSLQGIAIDWKETVTEVKVKGKVILRPTVSRPVCPGVKPPSGPVINFSFSLKFSLDSCGFVILLRPLWREDGSVIYCCCWFSPAQLRSGLSPAGLKTNFFCPNSWEFPNLEGQVPIFISPRNRVAEIYPRALSSFSIASYDSQSYDGGILSRLHMGKKPLQKCWT
jgi:hypothetical protein